MSKIKKKAVFIIRTKLQLIIADTVRKLNYAEHAVTMIVTAPRGREIEELSKMAEELLAHIDNLEIAVLSQSVNFFVYIKDFRKIIKKIAGTEIDAILLGSIDCARLATAIGFSRPREIETFDDGSANYRIKSLYFYRTKAKKSVRAKIKGIFFPRGAQGFFRKNTTRHYTIFSGPVNIVPRDKRVLITCNWANYLIKDDAELLETKYNYFLLGTAFTEAGMTNDLTTFLEPYAKRNCLAIAHPRSARTIVAGIQFHRIKGCVETLIDQVQKGHKSHKGKIGIAHFGSSIAYTMAANDGLEFVDLRRKLEESPDYALI